MESLLKAAAATVALSFLAAAAVPASAAVILTTDDGAGADTHVSNDTHQAATTNHGANASNDIRHFDDVRAKMGYYKFDLSNVTGDLSGATLTFTFTGAKRARAMNVYGLLDETGDAWDEGAITYATAPGILQPADGGVEYNTGNESFDPSDLAVVTTFTTPSSVSAGPVPATTAATPELDNFLAADNNDLVTFVLYPAASDSNASYFVASKENLGGATFYPTLTLPNATLVPEPGALSLAGLLGLAALARRRRHSS